MGDPVTISWEDDPDFLGAFKGALPGQYRYNHRMYHPDNPGRGDLWGALGPIDLGD